MERCGSTGADGNSWRRRRSCPGQCHGKDVRTGRWRCTAQAAEARDGRGAPVYRHPPKRPHKRRQPTEAGLQLVELQSVDKTGMTRSQLNSAAAKERWCAHRRAQTQASQAAATLGCDGAIVPARAVCEEPRHLGVIVPVDQQCDPQIVAFVSMPARKLDADALELKIWQKNAPHCQCATHCAALRFAQKYNVKKVAAHVGRHFVWCKT